MLFPHWPPRLRWTRSRLSLLLAVFAAAALLAISETGFNESTGALGDIEAAARTRASLNRVLQRMLDAETGSRGFLLTGDARYLEPYNQAVSEIGRDLDALAAEYKSYPDDAAVMGQVARDAQRKLAEMDLSVRMRKQGNEDTWKFVLMTDVGKEHMDAIRKETGQLIQLASVRMAISQEKVQRTLMLSRFGIAAVTLAAVLAFALYLRQTRALRLADEVQQDALQRERDQLEQLVRERTGTLAELATHLQNVREEERGHLARELHDELGALLTAAKLDVARLKSRLGPNPAPEVTQRLQHLTESLNSGIALKRRIIEDLRPSSLANLGLTASLEILGREFSERSGIEVASSLEPAQLDDALQLTVYRLVQESLTNVGKYAQARHVEVNLRDFGGHVEVEIRDDGKGFDPSRVKPSTHGLAGMRHRVEAAGGRLSIDAAPGRGARVRAVLPTATAARAPAAEGSEA